MTPIDDCRNTLTTESGGIDYDFYNKRARRLRSMAFADMFRACKHRASAHERLLTGWVVPDPCR